MLYKKCYLLSFAVFYLPSFPKIVCKKLYKSLKKFQFLTNFSILNHCRVPNVLQYAQKLGILVGSFLHQPPKESLNNQLYFLWSAYFFFRKENFMLHGNIYCFWWKTFYLTIYIFLLLFFLLLTILKKNEDQNMVYYLTSYGTYLLKDSANKPLHADKT